MAIDRSTAREGANRAMRLALLASSFVGAALSLWVVPIVGVLLFFNNTHELAGQLAVQVARLLDPAWPLRRGGFPGLGQLEADPFQAAILVPHPAGGCRRRRDFHCLPPRQRLGRL